MIKRINKYQKTNHNNFKPIKHISYNKELKMAEQQSHESVLYLSEFSTRLNEIEEKHRILRDRTLLIGENLISTKEETENDLTELKLKINDALSEIKSIKQILQRIIAELPNLAKKTEIEILKNQAAMFQPLELVRLKDIEHIIKK